MSEAEIKPGDVVMLKSGGPPMSVTHVEDRYGTMSAYCVWFEGTKKHQDSIPVVALTKDGGQGCAPSASNPRPQ